MAFAGIGTRVRGRNEVRRVAFGVDFIRVEDGLTYRATTSRLGADVITELVLQGMVNAANLDPHTFDLLPLDCPLAEGDFVIYPAGADASSRRYHVVKVLPDEYVAGVAVSRSAIVVIDPVQG